MTQTDFVERAENWLQSQLRAMACKVCQNYPSGIDIGDELDDIPSFAIIEHGSGCYTQSEDGGGESSVDVGESVVIVAGLLAELEKNETSERDDQTAKENALPLTAEILQASGWKPGTYGWIHADVRLLLFQEVGLHQAEPTGWRVAGLAGNARVETVGDLRKLLEALHVPAVVVVPRGGE